MSHSLMSWRGEERRSDCGGSLPSIPDRECVGGKHFYEIRIFLRRIRSNSDAKLLLLTHL